MFVSCDHCFAEYELDDAKIPAGGARLRCTGCDHYFVITPPEASDLQSADDLAHDALAPEVPNEADPEPERESEPGENFDLEEDSERDLALEEDLDVEGESEPESALAEDFELEGESEEESAFGEGFDLDGESDGESDLGDSFDLDGEIGGESAPEEDVDPDGESDWEFNDEVAISEPAVREEAAEPEFDRDGEWGDLSTAEEVVDDLLEPAGAIDADASSAVDDLLGEIDTADSQRSEPSGDLTAGPEHPSEGVGLGGADAVNGAAGDPAADLGDTFDDPSTWDIFDQPAETEVSAASAGPTSGPASAARGGARGAPRVEIAVAMVDDEPTSARWTERISEIAGWGAVCLMMIVALAGGLASNLSDARAPAGSWAGAGFEADQIAGRWVDNAVAGSIYVVSGRIRGAPGSDRASQKSLGIRLFDTAGREIDRAPIPLAPAVPERILREASPAELDAFQTRRAGRIAAVGTSWVSFEAVLTDLPRIAGRFELQALDR